MKLLITGAGGFLGRYVIAEALRRGHSVRAMVRSTDAEFPSGVTIARADLRSRRNLVEAIAGVDAIIHLAAAKSGDVYAQYAGTVVATENLLHAISEAGVRRLVAVSSLSVYDYGRIPAGATLTEESPLEKDAFERDEYAHTKLVQERLIRRHSDQHGVDLTVLRPGVIWGKENLWTARLGVQASSTLWIRTGGSAQVPLTYVENCAEAVVLATEKERAIGETFNVIDDNPPTQRGFAALLQRHVSPRPRILPVPLPVMRSIAGSATIANRMLFHGRAKIPGLFVPPRLEARCRPLRYSNARLKDMLGWRPRYSLDEAMARIVAVDPASFQEAAAEKGPA